MICCGTHGVSTKKEKKKQMLEHRDIGMGVGVNIS